MRYILLGSALALSACATGTMQSGVGFDDGYGPYRASREAELRGAAGPVLVDPANPAMPQGSDSPDVITGNELAAAGIGTGGNAPASSTFGQGTAFEPDGTPPTPEGTLIEPGATLAVPPAQPGGNVGISDEQDFDAVSSRESIQSDAERLAAQRQAYQVIPPEPLPQRPADTGPNIVAYALQTSNQPGEQIYSRTNILAETRFQRNCAGYSSSDKAQEAFLDAGGPQRDRMGLDPDGDGFACYWDPRPFRAARGG